MTTDRHGISIGIERTNSHFFLTMKVVGKLTHEDYQKISPMLDSALSGVDSPEINAFVDCTELEGWELKAAWDDFRMGMKHGREFRKIAVLGHKPWQHYMAKISSWFISGKAEYFEDAHEAFAWLEE
ncbi:MAG: STAS/SEC14 domain-containing protein [Motiliproteus sp.]|nr:STAS/SEC14 domain-containing protein [Motiliproteus sp.]MCW9052995.1 STAS/SEC14 domain-containing protein [Motiliproteus sp.]